MNVKCIILSGLAGAALLGCEKRGALTFEEMKPDDIVVQVNDNILQKKDMMRFWTMNCQLVQQMRGQDKYDAQQRIKQDLFEYAPTFVDQMLLVDDAKRAKVLTEEEAKDQVEKKIETVARARKMTKERFLSQFPDAEWYARKTAEIRVWIDAHVASNIPPVKVLTPEGVSNYLHVIKCETDAVQATNDWMKTRLEQLKKDVAVGKESFTNAAAKISQEKWDLGAVELLSSDLESAIRVKVFGAKAGEVLDLIDEPDCYRLYQVGWIVPAEKNEKGRTIHPEQRQLFQIVLMKEDYPLQMTYGEAAKDLAYQYQITAIENRLDYLKTNGQNRVVWPHGKNLWRKEK